MQVFDGADDCQEALPQAVPHRALGTMPESRLRCSARVEDHVAAAENGGDGGKAGALEGLPERRHFRVQWAHAAKEGGVAGHEAGIVRGSFYPGQNQLGQPFELRARGFDRLSLASVHADRDEVRARIDREEAAAAILVVGVDYGEERALAEARYRRTLLDRIRETQYALQLRAGRFRGVQVDRAVGEVAVRAPARLRELGRTGDDADPGIDPVRPLKLLARGQRARIDRRRGLCGRRLRDSREGAQSRRPSCRGRPSRSTVRASLPPGYGLDGVRASSRPLCPTPQVAAASLTGSVLLDRCPAEALSQSDLGTPLEVSMSARRYPRAPPRRTPPVARRPAVPGPRRLPTRPGRHQPRAGGDRGQPHPDRNRWWYRRWHRQGSSLRRDTRARLRHHQWRRRPGELCPKLRLEDRGHADRHARSGKPLHRLERGLHRDRAHVQAHHEPVPLRQGELRRQLRPDLHPECRRERHRQRHRHQPERPLAGHQLRHLGRHRGERRLHRQLSRRGPQ